MVVFSERLETLRWLHTQCKRDLRLRDPQITLMHGQLSDTEQQDIRALRAPGGPLRVLLCSDVASEGLNLHYFCHRLIHFDLPWSLMVFQQRNGRVDRYGQAQEPQILYLFTATQVEKIRGDLRILEILQQKDEQANLNLGDPASFLNVYDPDREVQKVSEFMANGMTPGAGVSNAGRAAGGRAGQRGRLAAAIVRRWGGSLGNGPALVSQSSDHIEAWPGLFKDEYEFAKAALIQLAPARDWLQWSTNDAEQGLAITAPPDLQERLQQLPVRYGAATTAMSCALTRRVSNKPLSSASGQGEMKRGRSCITCGRNTPLSSGWSTVITLFGRHRAPVIQSHHLQPGEQAFVMLGLVPNRKGQPLLVDWQVAAGTPASRLHWSPTRPLCSVLGSRPASYQIQG